MKIRGISPAAMSHPSWAVICLGQLHSVHTTSLHKDQLSPRTSSDACELLGKMNTNYTTTATTITITIIMITIVIINIHKYTYFSFIMYIWNKYRWSYSIYRSGSEPYGHQANMKWICPFDIFPIEYKQIVGLQNRSLWWDKMYIQEVLNKVEHF